MQLNNFSSNLYPHLSIEEAGALEILSYDGFVKDIVRDIGHRYQDDETVSEVQGSRKFCEVVAKVVFTSPSSLSLACLRSLKQVNQKLYRQLGWKHFAHAFSLSGKVPLPDGATLNLEGFNDPFSMTMLLNSFNKFAELNDNIEDEDMLKWVLHGLKTGNWHDNTTNEDLYKLFFKILDPSYLFSVVMSSGWDWHSVTILFYKNYFIYCNRGAASNEFPGWRIFRIGSKDNITPRFIQGLIKRLNSTSVNYHTLGNIIHYLNATEIFHCEMKKQSVGNCTYLSVKAAILALMTLWGCRKVIDSGQNLVKETVEVSLATAKQIYKNFANYDRQIILDNFFIDLELNKNVNEDTCSNKYDFDAVDKIKYLFLKKITNPEKSNLISFCHNIGWERWLQLDNYSKRFSFCSVADRKALRSYAILLAGKKNDNDIMKGLEKIILKFKYSDYVIQILENLHKNRLITFKQRVKICTVLTSKGKGKDLLSHFERLGFIADINNCKEVERRLKLVNHMILIKEWAEIIFLKIRSFQKNRLATFKQRLHICTQMALKGMEKELSTNFPRLGFIEDIKQSSNSKRRHELSNCIIEQKWATPEIKELVNKACFSPNTFAGEFAKCTT